MSQFLNSIGRMGRGNGPAPARQPSPGLQQSSAYGGDRDRSGTSPSPVSPVPGSASLRGPPSPLMRSPPSPGGDMSGGEQRQKPLYLCNPFVKAALVKGNFKTIVTLPKYCDLNEWVAVNSEFSDMIASFHFMGKAQAEELLKVYDFFTNLNLFYGVLSDVCTIHNCRTMSAGPTLDYTWIDASRKQVKLPAPTYIDYVMSWVQQTIDNGRDFPVKLGAEFPQNFPTITKQIYRQLLRVFAHIYHAHFPQLLHLSAEGHFNSLFAHFLAFGRLWDLLDLRDIRGRTGEPVGVGELWDKWKEMGILDA